MPPKVSHGGECAERAPVTYVSSNPVPASATSPAFETAAIRTAGACLLGLGLVLAVVLGLGELLPGLAVCLGGAAR
ncbi:hypothetical protein [Streptomyces avermitilis]|uniref:hypothetical protein n=1 Tax=Streptomyces avermitilis TaxID=33903 RepID=UPI003691C8C9